MYSFMLYFRKHSKQNLWHFYFNLFIRVKYCTKPVYVIHFTIKNIVCKVLSVWLHRWYFLSRVSIIKLCFKKFKQESDTLSWRVLNIYNCCDQILFNLECSSFLFNCQDLMVVVFIFNVNINLLAKTYQE